ncbi:hypothetical protein [Streptomyces sp. G-G2]|uniref:hypothetical protein n=1 Tax=Streptomyces sp. G-G2 TaxID=3046201 RepID=UPI0024BA506B|nr:hypothetical protein [Streptomyces sp. G-G2]MDJ0386201.1 hypothetical protein [Streptomyces sp. G-G2]
MSTPGETDTQPIGDQVEAEERVRTCRRAVVRQGAEPEGPDGAERARNVEWNIVRGDD